MLLDGTISVYSVSVKRNTLFLKICKIYCHSSKEIYNFDFDFDSEIEPLREWKGPRAVRE
jgi:hypothetical protein